MLLFLYLSNHKPKAIDCAQPVEKITNPCDNLIYSSYSNTPQICSVHHLPARHGNCFPNVCFNRSSIQPGTKRKPRLCLHFHILLHFPKTKWKLVRKTTKVMSVTQEYTHPALQTEGYCMHEQRYCLQMVTWTVLKHPIMLVVVLKLQQVDNKEPPGFIILEPRLMSAMITKAWHYCGIWSGVCGHVTWHFDILSLEHINSCYCLKGRLQEKEQQ